MKNRGRRRSIKTLFIEPFKQVRFGLYVITVSLIYVIIFSFIFARAFQEQYAQVLQLYMVTEESMNDFFTNDIFIKNSIILGLVLLAFAFTMLWVVITRTHRMYGPMVGISRFIDELQKGNYHVRLKTRETDDFQHIVNKLNSLASQLEEEKGDNFSQNNEEPSSVITSEIKNIESL